MRWAVRKRAHRIEQTANSRSRAKTIIHEFPSFIIMMLYLQIYENLAANLMAARTCNTRELTYLIKKYFYDAFKHLYVAGFNGNSEYLFDIAVLSCSPKDISPDSEDDYKLHIAVECELGGTSALTTKSVESNVIVNFSKLLFVDSVQKILIAVYSTPNNYKSESSTELISLIRYLQDVNNKSNNLVDVLTIFIKTVHTPGGSKQIEVCNPIEISGYILNKNKIYSELQLQPALVVKLSPY